MVTATKSVTQPMPINKDLDSMMETFRQMINYCIRLGLKHDVTTLKKFSTAFYHELDKYDMMGSYKLNAISQACGITNEKKHQKRQENKVTIHQKAIQTVTDSRSMET